MTHIKIIRKISSLIALFLFVTSCQTGISTFKEDFDSINDRVWIGENFWAIPIEDWKVQGGRLEASGNIRAKANILTCIMKEGRGDFIVSASMGIMDETGNPSAAGFEIGIKDHEDPDVRAACYFGRGINAGISTERFIYIGNKSITLPDNFDLTEFYISISGEEIDDKYILNLHVEDNRQAKADLSMDFNDDITGIVALVNNHKLNDSYNTISSFWFDNIELAGSKFERKNDNAFGPVLWTMYTLSDNILKLTAQMPPLGNDDNNLVQLQIKQGGKWNHKASASIDSLSRTALFRIPGWDAQNEISYRIVYEAHNKYNKIKTHYYEGLVRQEPVDKTLVMGGFTCQYHYGFPYTPLVENVISINPDILYFSGDQIYEQNGGYPVKRSPVETSILNYLGKYYMFGWAFGDLMKNRPTIVTPDDHDVYHGNLWGEGGEELSGTNTSSSTGYMQSPEFVNVVHKTQCGHLPDPHDPSPMKRNISVWYTSLNYGGVSFAIISDRIFKSGPTNVAFWEGREDHLTKPLKDPSSIESTELSLLGSRQKKFLEAWIEDWKGVYMKVLLSQTPFANAATHHGGITNYLYGDLDSGGWPKMQRDSILRIIRKAFTLHINGDQHLTSLIQYGVENFRDAGWSFCTPAIAVGYQRWFLPDIMNVPYSNRPDHGYDNTGYYTDAFGNKNYVHAVGNPAQISLPVMASERYVLAHEKASGFGIIRFDPSERNIYLESYRFLFDKNNPKENQFPGFPLTINQFDNYGKKATAWLPDLKIINGKDPVVRIVNERTGELEYIVRIKGQSFSPKVFSNDLFTIEIGYPELDQWIKFEKIETSSQSGKVEMIVDLGK